MLKRAFSYSAMGTTQTFDWFYRFKHEKLQLKIVSIQVIPPQVAQMKMWKKFAKPSVKTEEVPF
jgi:hypothetical protein